MTSSEIHELLMVWADDCVRDGSMPSLMLAKRGDEVLVLTNGPMERDDVLALLWAAVRKQPHDHPRYIDDRSD